MNQATKKKIKQSQFRYIPKRTKYKEQKAIDPKCQEATPEILRIEIDQIIKEFLDDPDKTEYIFPANLNNLQRKYIHSKAQAMNLSSKSHGKEPNRELHIKKKNKQLPNQSYYLTPCHEAENILQDFSTFSPATSRTYNHRHLKKREPFIGRLVSGGCGIPSKPNCSPDVTQVRKNLPIWEYRDIIMNTINNNQVTIISSETGSGKTTQVPQYILEDGHKDNRPCKVICTQPRRISTVGSAGRVSYERGDQLGASVGYHIKLEQKYGLHTNLIYCTTGVFLRNLMSGTDGLLNITHVILDEVHERDKLCDFLLICLKQSLEKYSHLKIILMSATVNAEKFRDYFGLGSCISIPGRLFAIDMMFLEQILLLTKYKSAKMRDAELNEGKKLQLKIGFFGEDTPSSSSHDDDSYMNEALDEYLNFSDKYDYRIHYEEATAQLGMYFLSEGVSVDYQHTITGRTALMIAAYLGDKEFISRLCNMGANMYLCDTMGRTAFDYAKENPGILQLLEYIKARREGISRNKNINDDAEHLLQLYDKTTPDDFIDFDLILTLITYIHRSPEQGSILVFLPGYDDIMMCNDRIVNSSLDSNSYHIYFLHGSMNIRDQHEVFKKLYNKRKIILATNIAETSITIDDVVFVIDTGKAKEKCYDSYNKVSSLQTRWISKACTKQRMGRAGRTRPGMCFRLYSQQRFENMEDERIPEMLRVSLEELCLHSKILAPHDMNIHNFLMMAPDTPSANSIRVAIENLQFLGALDKEEDLTRLGEYLAQLTLEPHLGKILIFGVIFKCLEPILTLVSAMTHKDPFQLPPQANLKSQAAERRKKLLDGVMSDHLLYLEVFRSWQNASMGGIAYQFCDNYFISQHTMNSILESRSQLLAQLRALNFVHQANSLEEYNMNANCWPLIKAVVSTGLYPNLAYPLGANLATKREKKVNIQHSSACGNRPITTWLIYDEMIKHRNSLLIRGVTAITPLTVSLMCGNDVIFPTPKSISIDDWLEFELPTATTIHLRKSIENLVRTLLLAPHHKYIDDELKVLKTLVLVLNSEERAADLTEPLDIGEKPKFFFPQNDLLRHRGNPKKPNSKINFNGTAEHGAQKLNGIVHRTPRKPARKILQGTTHTEEPSNSLVVCNSMRNLNLTPNTDLNSYPSSSGSRSTKNFGFVSKFNKYGDYTDDKIFLLIKPKLLKNVQIAHTSSYWIFAPQTEKKIMHFIGLRKQVYLLFTASASHSFQGIARFVCLHNEPFGKPTATIEWLFKAILDFKTIRHLRNGYNQNKPIYDGPDGQIVQQTVAEELYRIYESLKKVPINWEQLEYRTANSSLRYSYVPPRHLVYNKF